jgi:hypothetical protein
MNTFYEGIPYESDLEHYYLPSREKDEDRCRRVLTTDGTTYWVTEKLYKRLKKSVRKGVERPVVELEDGSISGLYPPAQLKVIYDFDEEAPEEENINATASNGEHELEKYSV